MTNFYSDLYSSQSPATEPEIGFRPEVSVYGGRIFYRRAKISVDGSVWDSSAIWRFMTFQSTDRLLELYLSWENMTGGLLSLGLSESREVAEGNIRLNGVTSSALVVDRTDLASPSSSYGVDRFADADLEDDDRGKRLYEHANEVSGGSNYASDPYDTFDIAGIITTSGTKPTAGVIVVEADYVQGGDRK